MKDAKPPKILVDLYRDLRDRRLLLPFILLAGALVLVPVALSKSSHPTGPAAGITGGSDAAASAAEPAVMTENVGIRNYERRLAALKQKDPFARHLRLPGLPGANPSRQTSTSPTTPTPTTAPPTSAGTASAYGSSASTTPPVTPSTAPPVGPTTTVTVPAPSQGPPSNLYHAVVDLKIGLPNKLKRRDGVKAVTELPHKSNPVVAFLGATLDRKTATFLTSRAVTAVHGGSDCSPTRSDCEILVMKPGGKAKLTDSKSGKTYVLKVLDIRLVRVKLSGQAGGGSGKSHSHSGGLGASGADAFSTGSGG